VQRNVASSTQNQALSALVFLYKDVLRIDLPWKAVIPAGNAGIQRQGGLVPFPLCLLQPQ